MPGRCLIYRYLCLYLIANSFFLQLSAQADIPLRFDNLIQKQGWSNGSVNDIIQDYQGFLWIATWSGLMKYDGYSLKRYWVEPDNSTGLSSNKITTVFQDSDHRLWVGSTYGGLFLYDRNKDRFIQYEHHPLDQHSLGNNNVWSITEDRYGTLWIGTEAGLSYLYAGDSSFSHFEHISGDSNSLSHPFVYSVTEDVHGQLWVGTEYGLNKLVRDEEHRPDHFQQYFLSPSGLSLNDERRHNFIYKVVPSLIHPSTLWICTSIGLKKVEYDETDFSLKLLKAYSHEEGSEGELSHRFVADVLEEKESERIWIATYKGINILDIQTGKFTYCLSDDKNQNSIANNVVHSLYKDRFENLWVGTENGVSWVNLSANPIFSDHLEGEEGKVNHVISCMTKASSSSGIWLGTVGGGIHYWEKSAKGKTSQRNFIFRNIATADHANFVSDLVLDRDKNLWISTEGAGIFSIPESNLVPGKWGTFQPANFSSTDSLLDNYVKRIYQTSSGDIWFGYWDRGLGRIDYEDGSFHHYAEVDDHSINLQAYPIVEMLEYSGAEHTTLIVGTRGGGALVLALDEATDSITLLDHFQMNGSTGKSLSSDYINFLFQDGDKLWIGTENGLNLVNLTTKEVVYFLEKDGLASGTIYAIEQDQIGRIWVSSQQGLSCISSPYSNPQILNFDTQDGLNENMMVYQGGLRFEDGSLAFGSINAVNYFDPLDIQIDSIPPQIVISDFKLFNQSVPIGPLESGRSILDRHISDTKKIELAYRDNVISFEFAGLQYAEPMKTKYAYQMVGFDKEWVYTGSNSRIAHYTNLPFGSYTFRVKAANGDGIWGEPAEIYLVIRPPLWLTPWAFILYFILGTGILYGIRKLLTLRTEFRHKLQLERLEREKLTEVNQMKLEFFTNVSHELRTPLTLIVSAIEQHLKEKHLDKKLYGSLRRMNRNAHRLMVMISQLLDIRKQEAGLMRLSAAEMDFVAFAREVTVSFGPLARQKKIKFSFESELAALPIWFDHKHMEKVLMNLLANSLKFTPSGGEVQVAVSQAFRNGEPVFGEITVEDSGMGIPPEQLSNIFDRFYQVRDTTVNGSQQGTGIGLSLVKHIVELHKGTIKAESNGIKGTRMTILLPLGDRHLSADEKSLLTEQAESISSYPGQSGIEERSSEMSDENELLPPAEKATLLLVEDNEDIRSLLSDHLEAAFHIIEARDGQEGLTFAREHQPDLVIADISMPVMDGIQMCEQVKSDVTTSHIPIILLTARTSLVYRVEGLERGADDYMTKPFNLQLLTARINNLIESRKKLREKFSHTLVLDDSEVTLNSLDEEFIKRMKVVLEENLSNSEFSVEMLADSLHVSRMQLYRKTKGLIGDSPVKIIRKFRLEMATKLLSNKQYNVSEVTFMVGYNDLKSFREQFKKEYGVSPSAYVKQKTHTNPNQN